MTDHRNGPRVKLTELREYESERTGKVYFAGYLGSTRLLMLRDDRAQCTGKEKARWTLFIEEAPPRSSSGPAPQGTNSAAKREDRATTAGASETNSRPARTAADRRAEAAMRERGLDPHAPMSSDPLPF